VCGNDGNPGGGAYESPLRNSGFRAGKGRRGPRTPEGMRKALSNLRPFPPGVSGNRRGRPGGCGASIREWLNVMHSWTLPRIFRASQSPTASAAKRAAARLWWDAVGNGPEAGKAVDRICNYTTGFVITPQAGPRNGVQTPTPGTNHADG
jgi:hypothetical protein